MKTNVKRRDSLRLLAGLIPVLIVAGCGGSDEQVYDLQDNASLKEARQILEQYAGGQPLGSEASDFDRLVSSVRETNSAEADVLQKAFTDIQANPANRASIAKEALKQLPNPGAAAP